MKITYVFNYFIKNLKTRNNILLLTLITLCISFSLSNSYNTLNTLNPDYSKNSIKTNSINPSNTKKLRKSSKVEQITPSTQQTNPNSSNKALYGTPVLNAPVTPLKDPEVLPNAQSGQIKKTPPTYPIAIRDNEALIKHIQKVINDIRDKVARRSTVLGDKLTPPQRMLKVYYDYRLANEALELVKKCPNLNSLDFIKFQEEGENKEHGYIYTIDTDSTIPVSEGFWTSFIKKIYDDVLTKIEALVGEANKNSNNPQPVGNDKLTYDKLPTTKAPLVTNEKYDSVTAIPKEKKPTVKDLNDLAASYSNYVTNYYTQYHHYYQLFNFLMLFHEKNYVFGCASNKCNYSLNNTGENKTITICKFNYNLKDGEPVWNKTFFSEEIENEKKMIPQLKKFDQTSLWAPKDKVNDVTLGDDFVLNFSVVAKSPISNDNPQNEVNSSVAGVSSGKTGDIDNRITIAAKKFRNNKINKK